MDVAMCVWAAGQGKPMGAHRPRAMGVRRSQSRIGYGAIPRGISLWVKSRNVSSARELSEVKGEGESPGRGSGTGNDIRCRACCGERMRRAEACGPFGARRLGGGSQAGSLLDV